MSSISLKELFFTLVFLLTVHSALAQTEIVVVDEYGSPLPTAHATACGENYYANLSGQITIPTSCDSLLVGSLGFTSELINLIQSDTIVLHLAANELGSVDVYGMETHYLDSLENAFEVSREYYEDSWHLPIPCSISHDVMLNGNRSWLRADTAVLQYYREIELFSHLESIGKPLPKYWTTSVTSEVRSTNVEFEKHFPNSINQLLKLAVPVGPSFSWYWSNLEENQVQRLNRTDDFTSYSITFERGRVRYVWFIELYTPNQTIHEFRRLSYCLPGSDTLDRNRGEEYADLPGTTGELRAIMTWINGHYVIEYVSVSFYSKKVSLSDGSKVHTQVNGLIKADWSMQVDKDRLTLANKQLIMLFPLDMTLDELPELSQ